MLALTDHQMSQLTRAAAMLPPSDRDLFLRSIANRLSGDPPTDADLAVAISFVLEGRGVRAPISLFLSNREKDHAIRRHR
jgi:hypothetical protein